MAITWYKKKLNKNIGNCNVFLEKILLRQEMAQVARHSNAIHY